MSEASGGHGGEVVITRFECRTLTNLAILLVVHVAVKREARRRCEGLLSSRAVVNWRRRSLLSISLWRQRDDIFGMGEVHRHIFAARLPHQLAIVTECGVYSYAGDWRAVMFGWDVHRPAPLDLPVKSEVSKRPRASRRST